MELSSDAPSSSVPLLAQDTQEAFLTPLSLINSLEKRSQLFPGLCTSKKASKSKGK